MPGMRATFAFILLAFCIFQVEAGWSTNTENTDSSSVTKSTVQKSSVKAPNQAASIVVGRKGALAEKSWDLEEEDLEDERGVHNVSAYDGMAGEETEQQEEGGGWFGFLGKRSKSAVKPEAPNREDDEGPELLRPSLRPNVTLAQLAAAVKPEGTELLGGRISINKTEDKLSKNKSWFTRSGTIPKAGGESETQDAEAVEGPLSDGPLFKETEKGPLRDSSWFTWTSTVVKGDGEGQPEDRKRDEGPLDEESQGELEAGLGDKSLTSKKGSSWFTRTSSTSEEEEASETEDKVDGGLVTTSQVDSEAGLAANASNASTADVERQSKGWGGWGLFAGKKDMGNKFEDATASTMRGSAATGALAKRDRVRGPIPETESTEGRLSVPHIGRDESKEQYERVTRVQPPKRVRGSVPETEGRLAVPKYEEDGESPSRVQKPKTLRGPVLDSEGHSTDSRAERDEVEDDERSLTQSQKPQRVWGPVLDSDGIRQGESDGSELEEESVIQVQKRDRVAGAGPKGWGRLTAPEDDGNELEEEEETFAQGPKPDKLRGASSKPEGLFTFPERERNEDEEEDIFTPAQKPGGLRGAIPKTKGPLTGATRVGADTEEDESLTRMQKPKSVRALNPETEEPPIDPNDERDVEVEEEGESLLELQKAARNSTTAALKAAILTAIGQVTNGSAWTDPEAAQKLIVELFGTGPTADGSDDLSDADLDNNTTPLKAKNDSVIFNETLYRMGVYKTNIGLQNLTALSGLLRPSNSTAGTPKKGTSFWHGVFGGAGQDAKASGEESDEGLLGMKSRFSEPVKRSNGSEEGVPQELSGSTESEELSFEEETGLADGPIEEKSEAGELAAMQSLTDRRTAVDPDGDALPFGSAKLEGLHNQSVSGQLQPLHSRGFNLTNTETLEESEGDKDVDESLEVESSIESISPRSSPKAGKQGIKSSDDQWGNYEDESGEGEAAFLENLFNPQTLGAVHEQAKTHLVPQVQALSQATTDAYDSTHKQIKASLDGVVGPKASGFTASVIVGLLLLVPGAAVVFICYRLKTVFSLQTSIFVCSSYLALYSLVLALIALAYKEPLSVFQRSYPGTYVMFQFLSLLAYIIFLTLCAISCWAAVKTGELSQQALGVGQLLPALAIGVHYFGTVWQPAMLDKAPHAKWTAYLMYAFASSSICAVTWFRRSRHEVLASGGSVFKQL